jgi:hypothetical protein
VAVPSVAAPTLGSSAIAEPPGCERERLAAHRLSNRGGSLRVRVKAGCLRPGARYVLLVRQGVTGRMLRTMPIMHDGSTTLRLHPGPTVNRLRIKLKRDGHDIAWRTMSLHA